MTEDKNEEIEDRVEQLESQVGDVSVADLEKRLDAIESHQERLESNIDALAQRTREESEKTPHIESVKQLYLQPGVVVGSGGGIAFTRGRLAF